MIVSKPLRALWKSSRGCSRILLTVFLVGIFVDSFYLALINHAARRASPTAHSRNTERVFIASIHWNNEKILRSHWNDALLDLVKDLGPRNVFVAALESGSWDESKEALQELDSQLASQGVQRSVILDEHTHKTEISRTPAEDEAGWVQTSPGRKERRRISYLADLRNQVMEKMIEAEAATGERFDKVIWLNDVIFKAEDVVTLLRTRDGEYAAACALDFSNPPYYYDTFALRDSTGAKTAINTWPYFSAGKSRNAMMLKSPVLVKSCWNGIVVMDAQPFRAPNPLKFRGLEDSLAEAHLEASECCLIHADNALSATKGVWLNPNVRVGYNAKAYQAVNAATAWPSATEKWRGIWMTRITTLPRYWQSKLESSIVAPRLRQWKSEGAAGTGQRTEVGDFCIVNEMQILSANGWKHL